MVEHHQQEMWWCIVIYKPASNHRGAAKLNCHLRNRGRVCFSLGVCYFSSLRFSPTLSLLPLTGANWFHFDYLSCCLRVPPLIKSHSTQEEEEENNLWKDGAISSVAVSSASLSHIKCSLIELYIYIYIFITRLFSTLWNAPFTCMGLPDFRWWISFQ